MLYHELGLFCITEWVENEPSNPLMRHARSRSTRNTILWSRNRSRSNTRWTRSPRTSDRSMRTPGSRPQEHAACVPVPGRPGAGRALPERTSPGRVVSFWSVRPRDGTDIARADVGGCSSVGSVTHKCTHKNNHRHKYKHKYRHTHTYRYKHTHTHKHKHKYKLRHEHIHMHKHKYRHEHM